jgi:hypothetical protein
MKNKRIETATEQNDYKCDITGCCVTIGASYATAYTTVAVKSQALLR